MATFLQNIKNIRGEAIYGPDVRRSIADALEQAINLEIGGDGEGLVFIVLTKIAETQDDYVLSFS